MVEKCLPMKVLLFGEEALSKKFVSINNIVFNAGMVLVVSTSAYQALGAGSSPATCSTRYC